MADGKGPDGSSLSPIELQTARDIGLFKDRFNPYQATVPSKRSEHMRTLLRYLDPAQPNGLRQELLKYCNRSGRLFVLDKSPSCGYWKINHHHTWCFGFKLRLNHHHDLTFGSYNELTDAYEAAETQEQSFIMSIGGFTKGTAPSIIGIILAFFDYLFSEEVPVMPSDDGAGGAAGGAGGASAEPEADINLLYNVFNGSFYARTEDTMLLLTFGIKIGKTTRSLTIYQDVHFVKSPPEEDGTVKVTFNQEAILEMINTVVISEARRLVTEATTARRRAKESTKKAVNSSIAAAAARRRADAAREAGDGAAHERYHTEFTQFTQSSEAYTAEADIARITSDDLFGASEDMHEVSNGYISRAHELAAGDIPRLAPVMSRDISAVSPPIPPAPLFRERRHEEKEEEALPMPPMPPMLPMLPMRTGSIASTPGTFQFRVADPMARIYRDVSTVPKDGDDGADGADDAMD